MLCMKYAILKELIYIFMQCMYNKNIFLRSFNNEINFYLSFVFLSTFYRHMYLHEYPKL